MNGQEEKILSALLLAAARRLFEGEHSPSRGDITTSLELAAVQLRSELEQSRAKVYAAVYAAIDLPSWRHDGSPDWDESLKILGEAKS